LGPAAAGDLGGTGGSEVALRNWKMVPQRGHTRLEAPLMASGENTWPHVGLGQGMLVAMANHFCR
jgi:hypothetical protein